MPAVAGYGEAWPASWISGDWRCERIGEETIDGRHAIAYRAVSASGHEIFGWIDPVRKFPLRIKTGDGATITAQNIRDEPQPAQLFEIPAGSPEIRSSGTHPSNQAKRRVGRP